MQNFFSGMGGGGGDGAAAAGGPQDDTPVWMKYAGKGAGVVGGCGKNKKKPCQKKILVVFVRFPQQLTLPLRDLGMGELILPRDYSYLN